MLILFQKYHKPINLLLLTLLGLSCGMLLSTLLDVSLDPGRQSSARVSPAVAAETAQMTTADLNRILERNVFDPGARDTYRFSPTARPTTERAADSDAGRRDRALLGTVVADDKSLALIRTGQELAVYRLEEELPDGGKLEEVRRNRAIVRNPDDSLTTLEIIEEPAGGPPARPTRSNDAEAETGIRQVDDNSWLISENTADAARQNLAEELRLAQMQPRIVDGRTDGFMIRSIKRRSLLNKLGLRRGDVIMSVNDMALDSPEKALQIFQQLREARQITVAVERRGETMTFAYELD